MVSRGLEVGKYGAVLWHSLEFGSFMNVLFGLLFSGRFIPFIHNFVSIGFGPFVSVFLLPHDISVFHGMELMFFVLHKHCHPVFLPLELQYAPFLNSCYISLQTPDTGSHWVRWVLW